MKVYKRKFRFKLFDKDTTLQSVEDYLETLEHWEKVISFSHTSYGMTVLIEYTELVESEG